MSTNASQTNDRRPIATKVKVRIAQEFQIYLVAAE